MSQLLLLPGLEPDESDKPVNVSSVPQLSPFRYPGGKTWLVPLFRRWIASLPERPKTVIEPFAGGGIISLTAAFEGLAKKVVMVELDRRVSAVWQTILNGGAELLAQRILHFDLSIESARAEFLKEPTTTFDLAFQTLVQNRTAHGGILAEGAGVIKTGEKGRGIQSRWYPQTIARRITSIAHVAERIAFIEGDAFEVMMRHQRSSCAVFFIDPPYTAGGKRAGSRLYTHSEIDHERLFALCERLEGDFLLTYDNAEEVRALARRHGFDSRPVAMKNTHHAEMRELLIGRNLAWVDAPSLVREESGKAALNEIAPRKLVRYVSKRTSKKSG